MNLKKVKNRIIINAGHHDADGGAQYGQYNEAQECKRIRDALVDVLDDRGYEVVEVPDNLTLYESIKFANSYAPQLNDGLAIDIHLNAFSNEAARGTEAFYGTSATSKVIASKLSAAVSGALGIPNRGAKTHTEAAVGSLGWIRDTTMWATLLEVCFISNPDDMRALTTGAPSGYRKVADGVADALDKLFGVERPDEPAYQSLSLFSTAKLINELKRRIETGEL